LAQFLIKHTDGHIEGPITAQQLREWVREGRVTRSTLIQVEGHVSWRSAGSVSGLTQQFEEADAAAAAQSVPDPLPVAEPANPSDSTAPAEPAAAPPSETNVVATAPARIGVLDRILRGSFQVARSFSVVVIALSLLVTVGGLALSVYAVFPSIYASVSALLPFQRMLQSRSVDNPTLAEFVEECSREARSEEAPRRSPARGLGLESEDGCSPYRRRSEAIVKRLDLPEQVVAMLCTQIEMLGPDSRDPFVSGLESLAEEFETNPPRGTNCTKVGAANWYLAEFSARVAREQAEKSSAAATIAERRGWLIPALIAIGAAIASLLSFLILPLLIQIERNTRPVS
jgi:hypothetical protein